MLIIASFLDKIDVHLYLMVYGMLPGQFDYYYNEQTEFGGWTFSIEDMAKLGIENVIYNGSGTYPDRRAAQEREIEIFRVP